MIGKNFGSYKIESKIGEGGMGVVYRALDTELDRPVAIKMMLASEGDESDEGVARFMREAKAASRLQHPAIMTIYQFGVQENTRYLVMEFIEGKTLKRIINNQPVQINQLCDIAVQVADALSVAHEKGVIHRDMKAENIMVTTRGHAKILDFGLAKMKDEALPTDATVTDMYKTQAGTVLGTVSHMSPEQAMGHEVDGKADVFSFGVVLYEMATGFSPFMGPTPQATLARLLNQAPKPVNELNPTTPAALEQLINRCLEKDPMRRPSAKEVTVELKRIQASLSAKDLQPLVNPQSQSGSFAGGIPASGSSSRQSVSVVPVSASKIMAPGSASTPLSAITPPEPVTPEQAKRLLLQYQAARALHWAVSLFTLTIPLSFFFKFLVAGGAVKSQLVYGTKLWAYTEWIVVPAQTTVANILNFSTKSGEWDFLLVGLGIAGFAVRHLLLIPVDKLEQWAKTKVVRAKAGGTKGAPAASVQERVSNQRLAMLREYSEAQRVLQQGRRHLAFLAVDIVGSTKMKVGEDKLVIEHAFSEYKKFAERILKGNNVWKVAWTPDGVMCAFLSAEDAAKAGQTILSELEWFNDGVHRLRTPFSVRCGINTGEVIFPDDKAMEEITDETIDVAGHMQKYASQNTLWLGKEVLGELESSAGFEQITTQMVDGRVPYEWKLRATAKAGSAD